VYDINRVVKCVLIKIMQSESFS